MLLQKNSTILSFTRIAVLAVAAIAVSACSGTGGPAVLASPAMAPSSVSLMMPDAAAAGGVNIINSKYTPKTLKIKVGTRVKFLNKDAQAHTVTADGGSFHSSFLAKNHAYSYTFKKAGRFPYHCQIHPYMTGMVVVSKS